MEYTWHDIRSISKKLDGKIIRGLTFVGHDDKNYKMCEIRSETGNIQFYQERPNGWIRIE